MILTKKTNLNSGKIMQSHIPRIQNYLIGFNLLSAINNTVTLEYAPAKLSSNYSLSLSKYLKTEVVRV